MAVVELGVQLWSVRDHLQHAPERTAEMLAKMGYQSAECFDLVLLDTIKPVFDQVGIALTSSFLFWPHITQNTEVAKRINYPWIPSAWGIQHEVDLALKNHVDTLVFGYFTPSERTVLDDFKHLADKLNHAGDVCRSQGVNLLYHNHGFEFEKMDGVVPYDILVARTEPTLVNFELDAFWSEMAGFKGVDIMQRYPQRVKQLHLKSGVFKDKAFFDDQALEHEAFKNLRDGELSMQALLKAAKALGITRMFVEQDFSNDIFHDLNESADFARSLIDEIYG